MNVENYLGNETSEWPELIKKLKEDNTEGQYDQATLSFGMALAFLEDALMGEQVMKRGSFEDYVPEASTLEYMVLDSQAI